MTSRRSTRLMALGGASALAIALAAPTAATATTDVEEPAEFSSAFVVAATPDQVIDPDGAEAPGEEGATGSFEFRIDAAAEIICYDITLSGVTGEYESPADTATHIHEAQRGEPGPPRIAFPDPVDDGSGTRTSDGCLQGPFTTGVLDDDGVDTGEGFSLAQIEADPTAFTGDSHTAEFVPGVVRGQLAQAAMPVDEPSEFSSEFTVTATPDEVIANDGQAAPGEQGAAGTFAFRIAADEEIVCYAISLTGVTGDYMSPAITATHIHEAALGEAGPPRIAFPDPEGDEERVSEGCLQGPFATGVLDDSGVDTGDGFSLAQIEADPAAFTGDSHTVDFAAGVVRGQLAETADESVPAESDAAPDAVTDDMATAETGMPVGAIVAIVLAIAAIVAIVIVVLRRRGATKP